MKHKLQLVVLGVMALASAGRAFESCLACNYETSMHCKRPPAVIGTFCGTQLYSDPTACLRQIKYEWVCQHSVQSIQILTSLQTGQTCTNYDCTAP